MIRNGIDWEGMGLNDVSRYNKIRRVLKTELKETPYNIEYSTEFRSDIEYNESALNEKLEEVLTTLTFREEKIMRLRFGIGTKKSHTLEEIAQMMEISRERTRQIVMKSLRKLRHPTRVKILNGFENGHSWGYYDGGFE
jgi:RNA polymerase sigma factor (sigma-70 family)|tara:strand:- start:151 stop:567 length:417 start_codon:yes stop_codon:yes gene_type:complete